MITLAKITQYIEDREDVAEGATWYDDEDGHLWLDSYEILSPFYTSRFPSLSDLVDWLNQQPITQEAYTVLTRTVDTQALYYAVASLYGNRYGQNPASY